MKFLLLFGAWFVVMQVVNFMMMAVTTMFVGPQDFEHIGYTIIMIIVNVKIFMIINKHLTLPNVE